MKFNFLIQLTSIVSASYLYNYTTTQSNTDVFSAQNCVDITLQNEVPTSIIQEQQITFTNYNSNYEVVYSTTTKTVTQSTFVIEEFITSTCDSVDFNIQDVSTTCSDVSVHMTDIFILNEATATLTNLAGDFEGLPVTSTEEMSTSTTESTSETTTGINGDLEGLPDEPVVEPEVIINEIEPEVVEVVRVNGAEFCQVVGLADVIANGTQQQFQTCSITVQGAIPDIEHMVSTIIVAPANNEQIVLGTNFTIVIKSLNIEYGFFDDPATLYYLSPQRLNSQGIIQGHNHVAIQKMLGPGEVPSAQNPLFFKGLNEASLDGTLSTDVNGALFTETGEYRLCTSSASQGHQPVLSPVARRFFQDDCIRFTIV